MEQQRGNYQHSLIVAKIKQTILKKNKDFLLKDIRTSKLAKSKEKGRENLDSLMKLYCSSLSVQGTR